MTSLEVRKSLEGGLIIGVVSKRTYQIRGSACELAPEQEPLVEEPVLTESGLLEHDSDRILQRQLVDVVVHGKARAPAPAASFTASVQIDGARRDLAVFGRRTLRLQASGAIAISAPEPIAEVDLTWQNAYGGVDRVLLANEGDPLIQLAEALGERLEPEQTVFAYPRNPHGRGYLIEPSQAAVSATELPHLEDPAQPLHAQNLLRGNPFHWPLAPLPACTAWLPYVHFPRSAQVGLPIRLFARDAIAPERFPEVQHGILRADALLEGAHISRRIHVAAAQGAAPAMRFASVEPGSTVELRHFHPQHAVWRWQLPPERPRVAYRLGKERPVELDAKIRSLCTQPDADRAAVVWVAEQRLEHAISREQIEHAEFGMKWKLEPGWH